MAEPVTLSQLAVDLARRWRVAAAVTLAVVAGAVAYGQALPNQYESSAVVAFSPKAGSGVGGDTLRVILPKYVAFATARATGRTVAAATGESAGRLRSAVTAGIATDTGNL